MFSNYLKTFFRNILRHGVYSATNLASLTIGLIASLLIFLWIWDEISFDQFHAKAERIQKVMVNDVYPNGDMDTYDAPTVMLGEPLKDIPGIEKVVQTSWGTEMLVVNGARSFSETGLYADSSFFSMFTFPIARGSSVRPLPDQQSIALSQKLADKLFPGEDPIGKIIRVNRTYDLMVSSVFADVPSNSSLQFEFLISFELWKKENQWARHWRSGAMQTFVLLNANARLDEVNEPVRKLIRQNCPDCSREAFLFPFAKLYLHNKFTNGNNTGGRIEQVYLFSLVAVAILAMACINFTNLATARASTRGREIGVRKSIGAQRSSLALQFLGESVMMSMMALCLAIVFISAVLPWFNQVTGKSITFDLSNLVLISVMGGVTVLCGLLAGSYPAFVLSSLNTTQVFKNNTFSALTGGGLRKTLVVVQFAVSIVLIAGSVIVYRQLSYIANKNLGYNRGNVIVIDHHEGILTNRNSFKNEVLQLPSVKSVAFVGSNLFQVPITTTDPVWSGKPQHSSISFKVLRCDDGFIPTMGIRLLSGRNFSNVNNEDASNYIINRKAMEAMGLSPDGVLGTELEMWNGKGKIIGVTDDFINGNLHENTQPLILMFTTSNGFYHYIRTVENTNSARTVAEVQRIVKKYEPDYPFQYSFLDDAFDREYQNEAVYGKLSLSFTSVAIIICCLGLFGLSSFMTERRVKELGIRKVFGASAGSLIVLLSGEFLKLVGLALMVGCPAAWYFGTQYLSGFAYHAELSTWVFLITMAGTFVMAFLTVLVQTARAANTNPINCLRTE